MLLPDRLDEQDETIVIDAPEFPIEVEDDEREKEVIQVEADVIEWFI